MRYIIIPIVVLLYLFWSWDTFKYHKERRRWGVDTNLPIWTFFTLGILSYLIKEYAIPFTIENW